MSVGISIVAQRTYPVAGALVADDGLVSDTTGGLLALFCLPFFFFVTVDPFESQPNLTNSR